MRTLLVISSFIIVLVAAFCVYFAFGLRAITLGCRGFSADCYIPAAQFLKDMQALAVMMFLGTAMLLFGYMFFVFSFVRSGGSSRNGSTDFSHPSADD